MIGLKRGLVKLEKHNKKWRLDFEKEKKRLLKETGSTSISIEHIGSTSIPGIMAKPVIDIAFGVSSMKDYRKQMKALKKADYIWRPGFGRIDQHLVFAKGTDISRTHYLHLMKYKGKNWDDHMFFRDHLRTHPKIAQQYNELKKQSMSKFPNERKNYQKMKNPFIAKVLADIRKKKKN